MTGRPTKYTAEILSKIEGYITNYEQYGDVVPSAAGFACSLKVSRSTVYKWAETHKAFSDMLGRLNSAQERVAMHKGLIGEWNATIVKLLLAKHGYHDKVDQNVEVKEYKVIPADESLIDAND